MYIVYNIVTLINTRVIFGHLHHLCVGFAKIIIPPPTPQHEDNIMLSRFPSGQRNVSIKCYSIFYFIHTVTI